MSNLLKLVISVIGCELVGILGSVFTVSSISTWYITLNKPPFAPPSWIFGPVWTILYFMMGVSFYLIWKRDWKKKKIRSAGNYFLVQLGLNFIWSPIFFGLKSPLLALLVILTLWALIVMTIRKFYSVSTWAAYLLIPYLLWVGFASLLNAAIFVLN